MFGRLTIFPSVAIRWGFVLRMALVSLIAGAALALWYPFFAKYATPFGADWYKIFRPAIFEALNGNSPYSVSGFFSAPWVLLLYSPFALLPAPFDLIALILVALASTGYVAHRLGAKPQTILLLLVTPQLLWGIVYGNNDWMAMLGLVLPQQLGLFLVMTKPQIGAPIALFWLAEAWRRGGVRETLRVFAPLIVVFLVCAMVFRSDLVKMGDASTTFWNQAHFPYLIPVGAVLVWRAIKSRKNGPAIMAGPFLAPYIGAQSLPTAALGLLPDQTETIIAILGLWLLWLLRGTV